ncbi:hypothetical protein [Flavobacterium sp.]|uniref:hypothetical protein n=1 Tax=Flavobacterium sp. TaxID=239 RepID=UPI0038FC0D9E
MKKIFLIVFVTSVFLACGPHRMSCGPRRTCIVIENRVQDQSSLNQIINVN